MQINKSVLFVISLLASLFAHGSYANQTAETGQNPAEVLEYKLALAEDGQTYQLIMKAEVAPKPDISLSGQVTIKVPHDSQFKVTNVNSLIKGANWVEASRIDAPSEDATHDYISFSFVGLQGNGARNYMWKTGEEQTVFTFQNEGGCVSDVALMADADPFNVSPNSVNTNPGNQFTNLGWGDVSENNYKANYGDSISCPE